MLSRVALAGGLGLLMLADAGRVFGAEPVPGRQTWTDADFYRKARLFPPFVVVKGETLETMHAVIGSRRFYHVRKGDTLLDLARFYGLGYNEITEANPGIDVWVPPVGQAIVLPTQWVLPQVPYAGVVINIPEMRLYYFHPKTGNGPLLVSTYPVGLGRDNWRTPQGEFRISGKTKNPRWVIPESIRKERIEKEGLSERSIAGGSPDNPLGKYRLELTLPSYRIHGTNIPWGVGMQVSHGCIRLYPEDIERLFEMVHVGEPGEFVYQPVKIGASAGRIYAEVHRDIYRLTPGPFREALRILESLGWSHRVDLQRLRRAVEEQSGVPLDITLDVTRDELPVETLRAPARGAGGASGSHESG